MPSTTTKRRSSRPSRSTTRQRDAIAVLKEDHREVEKLFKQFESTTAPARRRTIMRSIVEALSKHAAIEEELLYPWAREYIEDVDDDVFEALEEHRVVKWLLRELEHMDADDERFEARATVMMEMVRHHVEEEESELFQYLRDVGTRSELIELGEELEAAKRTAPTEPEIDLTAGNGAGAGDLVSSAIGHARDVGRDVVDRVSDITGVGG